MSPPLQGGARGLAVTNPFLAVFSDNFMMPTDLTHPPLQFEVIVRGRMRSSCCCVISNPARAGMPVQVPAPLVRFFA